MSKALTNVSTLANGLRVATHHMPHVETVSLGIWVGAGARHEAPDQHGISHLLEHMAFKGTARRTAIDIAEEIEAVGGELNAATSLETTAYYARLLKEDVGLALDILADILQAPRYSEDELEREREVILQEIAGTRDSPDELVYELLQEAAFPAQSIGRPILGTAESVTSFTAEDLRAFLRELAPITRRVIATRADSPRAASPEAVAKAAGELGLTVEIAPDVKSALDLAVDDSPLLVTGTLFVAGAVREALGLAEPDREWAAINAAHLAAASAP